ncbi:hypothetical protein ACIA5G_48555 [Amycolatopsis sp. NPDC051758]|uniref:hypothetical protein n=1 Tax=Amycolatopsis sp. NPDC051758 TaxID=3363935 RepID=UPI003787C8C6
MNVLHDFPSRRYALHIDTPESRAALAAAVDDDREAVRELAQEVAERPADFW